MVKRQKICALCYKFAPHIHYERFNQPLERKKPARIGVAFMGDFYDGEKAHWHTFIIFTKQPQNVDPGEPLPKNVWIGVSVNRKKDLWRIDELRQVQTSLRIISAEPLYENLGRINLEDIGWLIVGAQTKPLKQPKQSWIWNLIFQAAAYKIPIFLKNNLGHANPIQEFPSQEGSVKPGGNESKV